MSARDVTAEMSRAQLLEQVKRLEQENRELRDQNMQANRERIAAEWRVRNERDKRYDAEDRLAQVSEERDQANGRIAALSAGLFQRSPMGNPAMSEMDACQAALNWIDALLATPPTRQESAREEHPAVTAEDRLRSAESVVRHFAPMFCKHCQDWIQTIISTIWPTLGPNQPSDYFGSSHIAGSEAAAPRPAAAHTHDIPCANCGGPACPFELGGCSEKRPYCDTSVQMRDGRWACSERCWSILAQPAES